MQTLTELDMPLHWVDNSAALAEVCRAWHSVDALCIDTEFVRRRTFYPIPALLQFCDGQQITVIDPLEIDDWGPLVDVMAVDSVLKVFHACGEDLEVIWRLLGMTPTPLFDTQIAAGLCGLRPAMGYSALVAELCDLELPKDETNSNWLARPLSDEQLRYAAYDVYYLDAVYRHLRERVHALDRLEWVLQDSAAKRLALSTLVESADCYLRLKGAWRLSRAELAVARSLCAWREQLAREMDLPRSWLVKDGALLALARARPTSLPALSTLDLLPPSTIRKQGETLLRLIDEANSLPAEQWPKSLSKPGSPAGKRLIGQLQAAVVERAGQLDIAPEMLLTRRQMDAVAEIWTESGRADLPGESSAWRKDLLVPLLRQMEVK